MAERLVGEHRGERACSIDFPVKPNENKIGDYITLVSDNGGGNVADSATFNGEEDVYYARVALPSLRLLNISTRVRVLTGEQVLIAGFIVSGTDPKRVIIRGIGPSLSGFPGIWPTPLWNCTRAM